MDHVVARVWGRGFGLDPKRRDAGMVTAELAVSLFGVVIVLAMVIFAVGVAATQIRAQEGARAGARAAARGESNAEIRRVVVGTTEGARVAIRRSGNDIRVEVAMGVRVPIGGLHLSPVVVRSHSIAEREPS